MSQQQISKDLDRIAEYVKENLGARHEFTIDVMFQHSIHGLFDNEEYRKAAKTAKEYDERIVERRTSSGDFTTHHKLFG